jgi:hypothetical protein
MEKAWHIPIAFFFIRKIRHFSMLWPVNVFQNPSFIRFWHFFHLFSAEQEIPTFVTDSR